jgi:nicotinamidase-related amidase
MTETWNADIYEPLKPFVHREDVHCRKNRLSGMWAEDQPLRKHLKESGKKTLLFAGVNTDRCVLGTLADAAYAGWDCVLIDDCCATVTEEAHDSCVEAIEVRDKCICDCSWKFSIDPHSMSDSLLTGSSSYMALL